MMVFMLVTTKFIYCDIMLLIFHDWFLNIHIGFHIVSTFAAQRQMNISVRRSLHSPTSKFHKGLTVLVEIPS